MWQLLNLCIRSFPPSDDLFPYLSFYLYTQNERKCLFSLHRIRHNPSHQEFDYLPSYKEIIAVSDNTYFTKNTISLLHTTTNNDENNNSKENYNTNLTTSPAVMFQEFSNDDDAKSKKNKNKKNNNNNNNNNNSEGKGTTKINQQTNHHHPMMNRIPNDTPPPPPPTLTPFRKSPERKNGFIGTKQRPITKNLNHNDNNKYPTANETVNKTQQKTRYR